MYNMYDALTLRSCMAVQCILLFAEGEASWMARSADRSEYHKHPVIAGDQQQLAGSDHQHSECPLLCLPLQLSLFIRHNGVQISRKHF